MFQEDYEEFTEGQKKVLEQFVTNTTGNIFVLRNLPEVIKGALFSRYSRSSLGLRSLLLKEFILNEETEFDSIVGFKSADSSEDSSKDKQVVAIKKAQNFYDRILDGYGDDSIGELGGAHLAIENISMLAAKVLEDRRVGGSPLEKSTRYIYFDQKINEEYLFYRDQVLMTSAFRDLYLDTCNMLFQTYSKMIPPLTKIMEEKFPYEEGSPKAAYKAALRAKVLDCLRGLLPVSALTNMGVYGNGRFFEGMIQKLNVHNLAELEEVGKRAYEELSKVIPSFVRRSQVGHRHQEAFAKYYEQLDDDLRMVSAKVTQKEPAKVPPGVNMVACDEDAVYKIVAGLIFPHSNTSLDDLERAAKMMSQEELSKVLDASCSCRENRRHKSPRALEMANFTFEIVADFGIYRDLQRHRTLSQERQILNCSYGYYTPEEIIGTEMESEYHKAMESASIAYNAIAQELPEEAQYVIPMAYNIRWYFHINLRALQWLCELRSSPQGHPAYRYVAQEMAKQVSDRFPLLERYFKFVDYEGYNFGRLGQEVRKHEKMKSVGV
ncbi:MAG: FAD-dependent thymidylate synthase [Chlamydiales bacterium]|nr:FAD-dependent thymidylate synthase [Chlamydiales bacterium]